MRAMWTSFIGFMACGKSTVTRCLHDATRRPAVSLDELVVQRDGRTIPEIFAADGEAAFRALELAALESLDPDRNLVVDTGGGIVETPEAVAALRERGVVLWLDPPWEHVRARLKADGVERRPLVSRLGWAGTEDLFHRRRRLYAAAADFRLSGGQDADTLARTAMLRSLLWSRRREQVRR
jgi:shikimate kinase